MPRALDPQLLVSQEKEVNFNDVMETFKEVDINILLLDVFRKILQMPSSLRIFVQISES